MYMVRHNYPMIDFDIMIVALNGKDTFLYDEPNGAILHERLFRRNDSTKYAFFMMGANCYKIYTGGGIIIIF